MKKKYSILCAMAMTFTGTQAHATFIDFETFADGTPRSGWVNTPEEQRSNSASNEYASYGVTFTGSNVEGMPIVSTYAGSLTAELPIDNDWYVVTTVKDISNTDYDAVNFDIWMHFSNYVYSVSGDVVINPQYSATISAYDESDNLLASTVIPPGASTWIAGSFNFDTATPISRVHLLASDPHATVGLDNLSYTMVPLPASIWLFNAGCFFLYRVCKPPLKSVHA